MSPPPRLLPLGDAAWTVEFGDVFDPALHARVRALDARLARARAAGALDAGVIEWVPTLRSLSVHFDPLRCDANALGARLLALAQADGAAAPRGRHWRVPVYFGGADGADLAELAASAGVSVDAVVACLADITYEVCMLGFMPGFAYLAGVPPRLQRARLATPRTRVPAGALALAGPLCALYPSASPGGWRLLGRSPVALFDPHAAQPTLFEPGDTVRFAPIDADTCVRLATSLATLAATRAHCALPAPAP